MTRLRAAAGLALLLLVLAASGAAAHARLVDSNPVDGAVLDRPPGTATLRFTEAIATQFVTVRVSGPTASASAAPSTHGDVVTVRVPDQGPGSYWIDYRVVSADGHPVSGTLAFSVAGTATPAPAPTTQTATPTATQSTTTATEARATPARASGGLQAAGVQAGGDVAPMLAAATLLAAGAAVGTAVLLRRRASRRQ